MVVVCVCHVTLVSCVTNTALHSSPSGHPFLSPPSPVHPHEQLHALIHSVLNWWGPCLTAKSTAIPSSHLCTSMCPALPNHVPVSPFGRGTSGHCLALPKDRVSCSICHPGWATEFTFEVAAGNVSRQLVVHSLWKGIVLEAVSDRELPCWLGRSVHSTSKVLPPYLWYQCCSGLVTSTLCPSAWGSWRVICISVERWTAVEITLR